MGSLRVGAAQPRGVAAGCAISFLMGWIGCGEVKPGGEAGDTTPPTITMTAPAARTASVATDAAVRVTFSEAMDPATVSAASLVVRVAGAVDSAGAPVAPLGGTVSYAGMTASFAPSVPLRGGTTYTATVTTAATDRAGNPLAAQFDWTFTTRTTTCVKPGGGGGCQPTIAAAISTAQAGDSIAVANGTYMENLMIEKTVTLLGGFNAAYDQRDPSSLVSTIMPADPATPIVTITGTF